VRHRRVFLPDRVHEGELTGRPERDQRRQRLVEAEHRVQREQLRVGNADVWPVGRVVRIARRHDGGEPVEAAAKAHHNEGVAGVTGFSERQLRRAERPEAADHAERGKPSGATQEATPTHAGGVTLARWRGDLVGAIARHRSAW
jgi:hypothetical protein